MGIFIILNFFHHHAVPFSEAFLFVKISYGYTSPNDSNLFFSINEIYLLFYLKVSRLQEQLQAERDLRAALEVGLSMSSGQFSSSRGMDSKVLAYSSEICYPFSLLIASPIHIILRNLLM